MGTAYAEQLAEKQRHCADLLAGHDVEWLAPVAGPETGYRNKAKMVVGGSVDAPTLGILDADGRGVDLRECGVTGDAVRTAMPTLAAFISRAMLTPYDVPARRGELKYLLVTESATGELMLRFVLRTDEAVPRIRKHLAWLHSQLPQLAVVTANLQPEHKAVLEGACEIELTESVSMRMPAGDLTLRLLPQSFFQTNTSVATALYRQARTWIEELAPRTVWDLYCGVGGFALHAAGPGRQVTGVEVSPAAVDGAEAARDEAGISGVEFLVGDATEFAESAATAPDAVIVNPPRRGIGPRLGAWLEASSARHLVYSSCQASTLAKDLAAMPSWRVRRARVLDMFPQTRHYEVITLLERTAPSTGR